MLSFLFFVLFISAALTGALSAQNADAFNETSLQKESSVQEDQAPLSDTDSPQGKR